jgi:hypothetical protein
MAVMRITAIGWRAHDAVTGSGGLASVVAPLTESFYAAAAGELIWIGGPGTTLHPRAVLTPELAIPAKGATVRLVVDGVTPWRPAAAPPRASATTASARALRASLTDARGLGRLLFDTFGDDPVARKARPHVRALALACASGAALAFADAARPLLGLGSGLTPSGDDFVGGALFARRVLGDWNAGWDNALSHIVAEAATATHPISARLLADLAAGEGWAPLHETAAALAAADVAEASSAARRVTALGHTSGWDIIAGFLTAATA